MPTKLKLAPREVVARKEGDAWYLSSPMTLAEPPARLGDLLRRAAEWHPDRVFLIERAPDGSLRRVTYREALRGAEAVAAWLLAHAPLGGVDKHRVLALSGNSIDHALVMLGCFLAGVPFAPVSPAYSLMSKDYAKLSIIYDAIRPSVVFMESYAPFEDAWWNHVMMGRTHIGEIALLGTRDVAKEIGPGFASLRDVLGHALGPNEIEAVRAREATVGPEHVAKILFTSGSTGRPKGVPNTHRMLCSNQQMISQLWPFLLEEGHDAGSHLTIVDWLPWSHTFGGNHNFNMVLFHAGTLFVDDGKPTPALLENSLRNLREVQPTIYFNVPAGFAALVPRLEADDELREKFFSRLRVIFYAAAALPPDLWNRLVALAHKSGHHDVFMTTAWGSTETSPLATSMHFEEDSAGNIGLPAPGVTLKLVPNGKKLEVRVKGPNVMSGYWNEPELTKQAFDEEGFYKMGDAVRFAKMSAFGDGTHPEPSGGLLFDGRVVEDFKLANGTWVSVTTVRTGFLAHVEGVLSDAVVCGHDREELALLAWPNVTVCRSIASDSAAALSLEEICAHASVKERVRLALARWNAQHPGSSMRVSRVLLMKDPPSIDADEITDKGYINQRATLERRSIEISRVYAVTLGTTSHDGDDPHVVLAPV